MRCLVVEDDADIRADLSRALQAAGFVVDPADDGEAAWFRGDVEDYDAVVLDLGLPKLDGLSVLRRWRASGRAFPVIVLSARSDWTEKVEGIDAGADDYLAKPFQMGELVARVRGLVRRGAGRLSGVIDLGRLRLDTTRMTAVFDGAPARISPLEFRLLDYLAHRNGRPASAGELAEHLYGASDGGDANAIEALVARLRRKFGADIVVTRRGYGYLLDIVP
jgi:DNA-binding response OmpR family regulator